MKNNNLKLQAKKHFGQNFLINGSIQIKIFDIINELSYKYSPKWILEIGPGQGDITQYLVDLKLPVICLEIDIDSINLLAKKGFQSKISVVQGDGLEIMNQNKKDFINYLANNQRKNFRQSNPSDEADNFLFFSSLPYNVGSRILIDFAINHADTPFLVILQKEVVNKIKIHKKLTVFGIYLNLIYDLEHVFDINAGNFDPAPKVTSALLKGEVKNTLPSFMKSPEMRIKTLQTLKKLLLHPNKTFSNNLKNLGWNKEKIQSFLSENSMNENYRLQSNDIETILEKVLKNN
jgi:16S rRNA (adenine1518-N6/adenine1519-N6)-dimethyltransferase